MMKTTVWLLPLVGVCVLGCSSSEVDVPDATAPELKLSLAIQEGDAATVQSMIDANPELLTKRNPVGDQPLHTAIRTNNAAMTEVLLDLGAPLDDLSEEGETPLELALDVGADEEVIQLLE